MKIKLARITFVVLVLSGLFIGPYSGLAMRFFPSHIYWLPLPWPVPIFVP